MCQFILMTNPELMSTFDVTDANNRLSLDKENRKKVETEAMSYAIDWNDFYDELLSQPNLSWGDIRSRIYDHFVDIDDELNDPELFGNEPLVKPLIERINRIFGTLPTYLIDAQAELAQLRFNRGETPKVTNNDISLIRAGDTIIPDSDLYLMLADWQNEAITAISQLQNTELSGKDEYFADLLFPQVHRMMEIGLGKSIADDEYGYLKSGLYGPIKLANLLEKIGYETYITAAQWDTEAKIDLIAKNILSNGIEEYYFIQVKTTTKGDWAIYDTKDIHNKDYTALVDSCKNIKEMPTWDTDSIDIKPLWVIIEGAETGSMDFSDIHQKEPLNSDINSVRAIL